MIRGANECIQGGVSPCDFAQHIPVWKRLPFQPEQSYSCPMSRRSTNLGAGTPVGPAGEYLLYTKSECKLLTIGEQRFFIQITTRASVLESAPTKVIVFPKTMKVKKPTTTTIGEREIS
jgi:hypothetical protein